ncbi:MAG TPA: hypothetical protein DEO41_07990, partial [Betaproteobacteria bacterium]|nr:hypothetical protein [Betaproteobacteria bacterium]
AACPPPKLLVAWASDERTRTSSDEKAEEPPIIKMSNKNIRIAFCPIRPIYHEKKPVTSSLTKPF